MKHNKHIHQYKRQKLGKKTIFRCTLIGCSHYVYKELAENRVALCNRCGNPFMLDKPALTLAKPHCRQCTRIKHQEKVEKITALLEGMNA